MANKDPIQVLKDEHDRVLILLDNLEANISNKNLKLMSENISTLEKEFSKHSLNKEEKALFPEIEKFIPRDGGPTGVMVMEHKDLVGTLKDFKKAIKTKNFGRLSKDGNHIFDVLRPHIDKENNILFMMADMHLDEKQKDELAKKFRKFD